MLRFLKQLQIALLQTLEHDQFAVAKAAAYSAILTLFPAVLLISVDGLKPEAVLHAQEHGLALPNLARLAEDGVYSSGVRGVLPTVTYPSHTTLITGVSPAKHGISSNTTFDPYNKND